MKISKIIGCLIIIYLINAASCFGGKSEVFLGTAKAVYTGDGYMLATRSHNNTWDIQILGLASSTTTAHNLTISPTEKYASDVFINNITADGSLSAIKVKLPPGTQFANYVRNIFVNGNVNKITLTGADLGAGDGQDGLVKIKGSVKSIIVKGKKYRPFKGADYQWWGGNIWADINVSNSFNKILTKGGHIYYDSDGGILGNISAREDAKQILSKGAIVKIKKDDPASKVMFGGGISANVNVGDNKINTIKSKGGIISNGKISCRQLNQLKIIGQKILDTRPIMPPEKQGIHKVCAEIGNGSAESYKKCALKQLIVKNGSIRDSLFSAKGNIKTLKTIGETNNGMGLISNVTARAGYEGSLSKNQKPSITPSTCVTSLHTGVELIIPFIVDSSDSNELLTTRIKYRGPALDSVISNYNGETFFGTNRWKCSSYPQTGMFVWTSVDDDQGIYSNITVRVRDDSAPNLYDELSIVVSLFASNVAPTISVVPSDSPRIFNLAFETKLDWNVSVFDLDLSDPLTFSLENDSIGLVISNIATRTYYVFSTNNSFGFYSNISFKVTDSFGLTDSETISVHIISNFPPNVWTSLETNYFVRAPGESLEFFIVAEDTELTALTFPRPLELPSLAAYTTAVFNTDIPVSNAFLWTPDSSDTGIYNWSFFVYDSHDVSLSGTVTITGKVTNQFYNPAVPESPGEKFFLAPAYHPGDINNITIADSARRCKFIGGVDDNGSENWSIASYLGKIKNVKIIGTAETNTFVSLKEFKIPKKLNLDFDKNEIWINGTRETAP